MCVIAPTPRTLYMANTVDLSSTFNRHTTAPGAPRNLAMGHPFMIRLVVLLWDWLSRRPRISWSRLIRLHPSKRKILETSPYNL